MEPAALGDPAFWTENELRADTTLACPAEVPPDGASGPGCDVTPLPRTGCVPRGPGGTRPVADEVVVGGWTVPAALAAWNAGAMTVDWCGALPDGDAHATLTADGTAIFGGAPYPDARPPLVNECPWRQLVAIPARLRTAFLPAPGAVWLLVTGPDPRTWTVVGREAEVPPAPLHPGARAAVAPDAPAGTTSGASFGGGACEPRRAVTAWVTLADGATRQVRGAWSWTPRP